MKYKLLKITDKDGVEKQTDIKGKVIGIDCITINLPLFIQLKESKVKPTTKVEEIVTFGKVKTVVTKNSIYHLEELVEG